MIIKRMNMQNLYQNLGLAERIESSIVFQNLISPIYSVHTKNIYIYLTSLLEHNLFDMNN